MKHNWETQEVKRWLINDAACLEELQGKSANQVIVFVGDNHAPAGLYSSFARAPRSVFTDVDWNEVVRSINETE